MNTLEIKNPEFVDLEKTTVRLTLIRENGVESIAEFKVPDNQERGVNPYWDKVLDQFDVDEMKKRRNMIEINNRKMNAFRMKKQQASVENEKLRDLFDLKMQAFNLPFVANATDEDKAAVRRAPSILLLNIVISSLAIKYMQENEMTYIDLFDYLDDLEDERLASLAKKEDDSANPTTEYLVEE